MSLKVSRWVWENSTVPAKDLLVLLAVADYADDTGRAYPSVSSVARKARTSTSTARRALARLAEAGHLSVQASKGGRSNNTYTVSMSIEAATTAPENDPEAPNPGDIEQPDSSPGESKVVHTPVNLTALPIQSATPALPERHPSPVNLTGAVVHTPVNLTAQPWHSSDTPALSELCHPNHHRTTINPTTEAAGSVPIGGGGGQPATNPAPSHSDVPVDTRTPKFPTELRPSARVGASAGGSSETHSEPRRPCVAPDSGPAATQPRETLQSSVTSPSGIDAGVGPRSNVPTEDDVDADITAVFERLPKAWAVGPKSRRRLTPALRIALNDGWTPPELAAHLGTNPEGVKSPAAVLAARLDDLPPAPKQPSVRAVPPWCGSCDHADTRFIQLDDGRVAPCPACNPKASAA